MPPPPESHTPTTPIRIDRELWARFGDAAGARNRSAVLRDFIRWYLREPGARMPKRPDPGPGHDPVS